MCKHDNGCSENLCWRTCDEPIDGNVEINGALQHPCLIENTINRVNRITIVLLDCK